jgi:hypothetical protein
MHVNAAVPRMIQRINGFPAARSGGPVNGLCRELVSASVTQQGLQDQIMYMRRPEWRESHVTVLSDVMPVLVQLVECSSNFGKNNPRNYSMNLGYCSATLACEAGCAT